MIYHVILKILGGLKMVEFNAARVWLQDESGGDSLMCNRQRTMSVDVTCHSLISERSSVM